MPIRHRGTPAVWWQPDDGTEPVRLDGITGMTLDDHPARGVPYSVSWFDQGAMLRLDRVYLLERLTDPAGFRLLDALTGVVHVVFRENMPLFKPPTAPGLITGTLR